MTVSRLFGNVAGSITSEIAGATRAGNCLTDSFSVQGASASTNPPVVCGTLTGQHVYVEADPDRCNRLTFSLGDGVVTTLVTTNSRGITSLATRTWDIRAQMIECTSLTLPPPGCTQYFWSTASTTKYIIQSSNWLTTDSATSVSTWHLANQHDRFCFRRERGKCIGCFAASAITMVQLSASNAVGNHFTTPGGCCGYGTNAGSVFGLNADNDAQMGHGFNEAGDNVFNYGFDCLIIPGAFGNTETNNEGTPSVAQTTTLTAQTLLASSAMPMHWPPQICGSEGGIGIGAVDLEEAAMDMEEIAAEAQGVLAVGNAEGAGELGVAVNLSVCTRNTPFTLEFMSDDIDGQGGETGNTEWQSATQNRGFQLHVDQIDCS